jgi:hypothetical protein
MYHGLYQIQVGAQRDEKEDELFHASPQKEQSRTQCEYITLKITLISTQTRFLITIIHKNSSFFACF